MFVLSNQLIINVGKNKFMVFLRNNQLVPTILSPFHINTTSINGVISFKFQGVMFNISFNFKEHVRNITKNTSKFIPLIYRIRDYLNRALVMQLYFGHIYHDSIYCISVWGASKKNAINPLQNSQDKWVRAICGADRMDSARPLYNSLKKSNVKGVYD